ncbi:MAG: hypothetical protein ABIQ40_01690 [Bacteroidia bacterium]
MLLLPPFIITTPGWMKGMNRNTIGSYGEYMGRVNFYHLRSLFTAIS